ncbi:MAG: glycoside hydrolase family 20 zincin-like fold domain-containing protein, partial [Alistipes sp.]|nr:glycoside hydrolase family 20 zincin-like fold domain-containing protein [Alistipes sp.]
MKTISIPRASFPAALLFGVLLFGALGAKAQNFVPQPVSVAWGEGEVALTAYRTVEAADARLNPLAAYLSELLPAGRVRLSLDMAGKLPAEGYRLEVAREGVTISGVDYGGVWNGVQTLWQLLPPGVDSRDGGLGAG